MKIVLNEEDIKEILFNCLQTDYNIDSSTGQLLITNDKITYEAELYEK